MQQSLSIMGDASGTDIIPETELKARDEALSQLTSKLDKYQTTFYASISTHPTDLESAFESESTRDEEMSMVQDQANQLDHILGTATNLKEIGYEINEEIGVHCRLLEEIESREDEIFAKQKRNDKLLTQWMDSKSNPLTWLWGIVAVLFFTFVYVLML